MSSFSWPVEIWLSGCWLLSRHLVHHYWKSHAVPSSPSSEHVGSQCLRRPHHSQGACLGAYGTGLTWLRPRVVPAVKCLPELGRL